ncbi:MAG: class I SAM-dependent methyltransferase [Chloroflexia bacterium]|nr:class I SAM-dependent methyltransferase [Chloroflexia bacterium]
MSTVNPQVCPVEKAGALDNKFRKLLQNPQKIVGPYLKGDMIVLDFGCGPGFFSIEIAKLLNNKGKVISADLQKGMLDKIEHKISGTYLESKIELHQCSVNNIGLSDPVDFILAFYVVHEVSDQKKLFTEFYSLLKENCKLLIVEPFFHVTKNKFADMLQITAECGFKVAEKPKLFFSRAVLLTKS